MPETITVKEIRLLLEHFKNVPDVRPLPPSFLRLVELAQRPIDPALAASSFHAFERILVDVLFNASLGYEVDAVAVPSIVKRIMTGFIEQVLAETEAVGVELTVAAFMRARLRALDFAIQEVTKNATPR